jgi:hypothetical protein
VEGGEVIITKPAVESVRKYNFEGKQMTPKEIMSKLNSDHGGVSFKKGGEIKKTKYSTGGLITKQEEDEINKSYVGQSMVFTYNDDLRTKKYIIESILLQNQDNFTAKCNNNEFASLHELVVVGSYVFVKRFNDNERDRELFGNKYYEEVIEKRGYNIYIPWRVVDLEFIDDALVKLTLGRNEDDEYYQFDFNLQYYNSDRVVVINTPTIHLDQEYPTQENTLLLQPHLFGTLALRLSYNSSLGAGKMFYPTNNYASFYSHNWVENKNQERYPKYVCKNLEGHSISGVVQDDVAIKHDEHMVLFVGAKCNLYVDENYHVEEVSEYEISGKTYYSFNTNKQVNIDYDKKYPNGVRYKIFDCIIKGFFTPINNVTRVTAIIFESNGITYAIDFAKSRTDVDSLFFGMVENFVDIENRWGNSNMTDTEKLIRKYRKKEKSDKELYGELINALDIEILQYQTIRDFTNPNQKTKINQIDRKLEELREQRDKYALEYDTNVELIDKLGKTLEISRIEKEEPPTTRLSINGQPSELTDSQYDKVRTEKFKAWFGDWINAYEFDNYAGVSKVINSRTKEPIVCYHGSRADFMSWRFNDFPAAYFADNRSYSQWFANLSSDGFMYQVFIDIKNPIDVMFMGIKEFTIREIMEHLRDTYDLPLEQILPRYKQYEAGGEDVLEQYLNAPMKFWQFIRHHNPNLINYLRDNTFYDGIMMYEDNLQDIVNGQPNTTGSYMVFRQSQIKWATAEHFNTQVNNAGFAKGGMLPPDYTNLTLDDI